MHTEDDYISEEIKIKKQMRDGFEEFYDEQKFNISFHILCSSLIHFDQDHSLGIP